MRLIINDIRSHYLYPSTLFISKDSHTIKTILGSCISVCLFDKRQKIGGMNHFMMPFWNGEGLASPKYGNIAMETMIEQMTQLGSRQKDWIAKVFGGAHQFNAKSSISMIGNNNIDVAETMLRKYKIPIVAQSVGGTQGRKISFDTSTGVVLMKYIVKQDY